MLCGGDGGGGIAAHVYTHMTHTHTRRERQTHSHAHFDFSQKFIDKHWTIFLVVISNTFSHEHYNNNTHVKKMYYHQQR